MADRVRLGRDERRQRLLDSARTLFGQSGYRLTEVDQIARRAGVTKPMLYKHFPGGKGEIYAAVLDDHLAELLRVLWQAMASSDQPRVRLHRGLAAYVEFADVNPEGFRLLVESSGDVAPEVGPRMVQVRRTVAGGLANTISDVMRAANLPTEGAPIYAYALMGGVESAVRWWLEQKPFDADRITDYLLAFVWRGFDGLPRDPTRFHLYGEQER